MVWKSVLVLVSLAATALPITPAAAQQARITEAQCRMLVRHTPAADVAYQPGVDVNGRSVVPADLDAGPQIAPPRELTIDLTVDLFDRFGIPGDKSLYNGKVDIGSVTVRGNQAWYNGQPLGGDAQGALAQVCRETYGF